MILLRDYCDSIGLSYRYRERGFSLSIADYDRRTPLHLAASNGHTEVVQFLLEECHVDVSPKDRCQHLFFCLYLLYIAHLLVGITLRATMQEYMGM